jgi:hypothetical protein
MANEKTEVQLKPLTLGRTSKHDSIKLNFAEIYDYMHIHDIFLLQRAQFQIYDSKILK